MLRFDRNIFSVNAAICYEFIVRFDDGGLRSNRIGCHNVWLCLADSLSDHLIAGSGEWFLFSHGLLPFLLLSLSFCLRDERERIERNVITNSIDIIEKHGKEWAEITGRPFDLVDAWGCEDADYIVVCLGSNAGNVRFEARKLREEGKKVGVVRPRVFRPFPEKQIAEACKNAKGIAVIDRSDSFGSPSAPLALEVRNALYRAGLNIPVSDYIAGLGGADITLDQIKQVYTELEQGGNSSLTYLGVEE